MNIIGDYFKNLAAIFGSLLISALFSYLVYLYYHDFRVHDHCNIGSNRYSINLSSILHDTTPVTQLVENNVQCLDFNVSFKHRPIFKKKDWSIRVTFGDQLKLTRSITAPYLCNFGPAWQWSIESPNKIYLQSADASKVKPMCIHKSIQEAGATSN